MLSVNEVATVTLLQNEQTQFWKTTKQKDNIFMIFEDVDKNKFSRMDEIIFSGWLVYNLTSLLQINRKYSSLYPGT